MKTAIMAVAIILLAQSAPAQQCAGDFNNDGAVQINEIILTVNNSLNGCVTNGLTCPIDFGDDNTAAGTPDCFYTGRWNATCGADNLETRFISDLGDQADPSDDLVVVELLGFTPRLFYGAATTSDTTADLIGWFTQPDNPNDQPVVHNAPGSLTLTPDKTLVIAPNAVPFQIEGCDFVRYEGALTDVVQGSAQTSAIPTRIDPSVMQRLRGALVRRAAPPNFERQ